MKSINNIIINLSFQVIIKQNFNKNNNLSNNNKTSSNNINNKII